jgi:hypothetical protein
MKADGEDELKLPGDIEDKLYNSFVFGAIWGIGGCLEERTRPKFDIFMQELLNGEDVITKHSLDMEGKTYEVTKVPHKITELK